MNTLCGDCEYAEYKYEYHFPHPEEWYWFCNFLKRRLEARLCILGGVYRDSRCPKLLVEATPNKEKE